MNYNEFSNNSTIIEDAIMCGKILLHKTEWDLSFICDFCHKNLPTLTELLRHALSKHIDDVPQGKVRELCDIETTEEIDLEFDDRDTLDAEPLDHHNIGNSACNSESESDENESIGSVEENKPDIDTFDVEENSGYRGHIVLETKREKSLRQQKVKRTDEFDDDDTERSRFELENEINSKRSNSYNDNFEFFDVASKNAQKLRISEILKGKSRKSILICAVCNVKFPTRRQLAVHRKTHGDRPFICEQCGSAFTDKRNLTVHTFRHLGIKPHTCTFCEMTFTTKTELNIHMRTHTGERPYKCNECDKRFPCASDRTKHQLRHKNVRSCLCPVCGKTFIDSKNMKNHLRTHSTERPHKCQQCEATFTTVCGLRQHKELHSDVKKYGCKLCSKTFAQGAGLYSHMKSVHKNENI